jgi:hypothetical protein
MLMGGDASRVVWNPMDRGGAGGAALFIIGGMCGEVGSAVDRAVRFRVPMWDELAAEGNGEESGGGERRRGARKGIMQEGGRAAAQEGERRS